MGLASRNPPAKEDAPDQDEIAARCGVNDNTDFPAETAAAAIHVNMILLVFAEWLFLCLDRIDSRTISIVPN